ncbi:MAG: type II toxin-antitoxin system HicB family antitoxin [Dorea sp.]|jgi:predicted RNase H-like HicB family nuclease|uniref:type II toxin-antitoxin system HicB family antitoxin n=1 Tax=Sporofaciens sp. JLR.KK001 TaxID=3112621 RepID=UPI002171750D|nr:type II toxin-antitoxin system HicB family antitoxin [Dorea sp.]
MNKLVFYPAIFHKAEDGGFWISFPDLPECLTEGNDMTQAYEMAVNALGLALTSREIENEPIPEPSAPSDIIVEKDSFLVVVEFDILAYKKRTSPRAVKKTLSIPEWLNEEATAIGVNFSQVLQEALMQKLQTK